jgi:hypothetical protein
MLIYIAAVFVLGLSFWLTLMVMEYTRADQIRILDATYGLGCNISNGNATKALAEVCGGSSKTCQYVVDSAKLGDPAPGCAKDFVVKWQCQADKEIHEFQIPGEADGKVVDIHC